MRPAALALNILVASFTSFRYVRAGLFRWRTVWPFLLGAIPFAFFSGAIQLPGTYSRPLVGIGGCRSPNRSMRCMECDRAFEGQVPLALYRLGETPLYLMPRGGRTDPCPVTRLRLRYAHDY
jgi:hypothetical protein